MTVANIKFEQSWNSQYFKNIIITININNRLNRVKSTSKANNVTKRVWFACQYKSTFNIIINRLNSVLDMKWYHIFSNVTNVNISIHRQHNTMLWTPQSLRAFIEELCSKLTHYGKVTLYSYAQIKVEV